jgi:hypothetical protein
MGFRFDLTGAELEPNTKSVTPVDDKKSEIEQSTHGAGIALSWGANFGNLLPGAQIGFKFPDKEYYEDEKGKSSTILTNGVFSLGANTWLLLDDSNSVFAGLTFATLFPEDHQGDEAVLGYKPYKEGGAWGLDFSLHYQYELDAGGFGFKVRPRLGVNFVSVSHDSTEKDAIDQAEDNYTEVGLGFDLGLKFKVNEKVAIYTGASLDLFKWNILGHSGGDKGKKTTDDSNAWTFSGIEWTGRRWTGSSTLGFGLTWTPIEKLVIGMGLNTFLDKFVEVDLEQVQVRSGSFFNDNGSAHLGTWVGELFKDLKFDLTVSYTF